MMTPIKVEIATDGKLLTRMMMLLFVVYGVCFIIVSDRVEQRQNRLEERLERVEQMLRDGC